ncbi:Hypothetical predicted protein [Xyrichtys novacula]|uniref:Secreted protein n=1 Tax=Xyrichtys novacula TaxID=13765 RepID=A0AAV1FVT7_XYRNO|nr:Hypothetical predicted protein [Xyrichtys novacula]
MVDGTESLFFLCVYILQSDACALIVFLLHQANDGIDSSNLGVPEKQICLPVRANRDTRESADVYKLTHSGGNRLVVFLRHADVDSRRKCWHVTLVSNPSFCGVHFIKK